MSPGALVTLELKRALRSSTAFCVRVSLVHSGSRGGGSEEIQEETRFTNNTGAVQVAPEKQDFSYLTEEIATAMERYGIM